MSDRTYWHVPGARSWHAQNPAGLWIYTAFCGRFVNEGPIPETADRIPPTAHLCGNCARIIAAQTDIEPPRPMRIPGLAEAVRETLLDDKPIPFVGDGDGSVEEGAPI